MIMKKWIAYIGYITTVTMIFLYYLFPSHAVKTYINYHVSRAWPQLQLTASEAVPAFPPGLKLIRPVLYRDQQAIADAQYVKLMPGWLTLFSAEKIFHIRGDVYEGAVSGTVAISKLDTSPAIDLDLVFGGIKAGSIPIISALLSHDIDGIAAGRFFFNNVENPAGQGSLELTITDGSVALNPPFLGIAQLSFNSVEAQAELVDRRIRISSLTVKGQEVNLNATGTIVLREPFETSALNISGQILPHPSFIRNLAGMVPAGMISEKSISGGGIPFRISGTVSNPGFSLK